MANPPSRSEGSVPPKSEGKAAVNDSFDSLFAHYGSNYRWYALLAVGLGSFSALMMSTSINVAIPDVMGAFGIGQDVAQWLSTGYLAGSTVSMLITAWCIATWGVRISYLLPTFLFCGASLLGALATNIEVMILSRVLQGIASGIYLPLATFMVTRIFPANKQGVGMGIFGIIAVMGPAIGPYTGGVLIDAFSWRAVFFLPLPMSLLSIPLAQIMLPNRDSSAKAPRLDWWGIGLLSISLTLLLNGATKGQEKGWDSDYTYIGLALGAMAAYAFIWRQNNTPSPLLDLRLFRNPAFIQSAIISVIYGVALYSGMYTVPLFLQSIQGISPTEAGLTLLPGGLSMVVALLIGGHLSDRFPPHIIMFVGLIMLTYSFAVMFDANRFTSLAMIAWWVVIGRIGMSIVMPALNVAAFSTLPQELLTQAAGAVNFLRQLGGAIGVNLISVYLARQTSHHIDRIGETQQADNPQTQLMLETLVPSLHQSGIDASLQEPLAGWILASELYRQAMNLAFQDAFVLTAIMAALGIIPALMVKRILAKAKQQPR